LPQHHITCKPIYVYVPAGNGTTLSVGAFQSFFHSTGKTGFNGIVMDLLMAGRLGRWLGL